MIQANELRIGNLIYWNIPEKLNVLHEVVGIRNGRPQTIPISLGDSINDYSPIPLTTEILEKCGFEWEDIKTHTDKTTRGLYKGILMMLPTNNEWWYAAPFGYPLALERTLHIHQLQNLYFALTNEELTFKP